MAAPPSRPVSPSRPAPPTRPVLRERYERRHSELVDRAARRFARTGYDTTTMADLAASMGLATGALYHYFGAKDELLRAICDELMEPLLVSARALLSASEAEPAETRLRALVRLWVVHVCAHRDHMRVFQQERHVIESGEPWRAVRASRKAFERLVGGTLQAALEGTDGGGVSGTSGASGVSGTSGFGGPGTSGGGLRLLALLGMVNHTAQWYRPRGRLTPEQIADGYVALVLAAA